MRCSAPGLFFCPRLRFAPPRFVLRRCKYLRPVSRWSYGRRHFQRSRQHALPQCVSQCASCALIIVCSYAGDWKQDALAAPTWAGRELHTVVQLSSGQLVLMAAPPIATIVARALSMTSGCRALSEVKSKLFGCMVLIVMYSHLAANQRTGRSRALGSSLRPHVFGCE